MPAAMAGVLGTPRMPAPGAGRRRLECGVEPLDVRGVNDPIALRPAPEHLDTCWRPSNDTALHIDHTPLLMVLHDLCNTDVAPRAQPRTPVLPQSHRITKRREDG